MSVMWGSRGSKHSWSVQSLKLIESCITIDCEPGSVLALGIQEGKDAPGSPCLLVHLIIWDAMN